MNTVSVPLMPQQVRVVAQTAYLGDGHAQVSRTITVPGEPAEALDRWEQLQLAQPALRVHIENDHGSLMQRVGASTHNEADPLCSMSVLSSDGFSTRIRLVIHHSLADAHSWSIIEDALLGAEIPYFSVEDYANVVDRVNNRFDNNSDNGSSWDELAKMINEDPPPAHPRIGSAIHMSTEINAAEWGALSQKLGVGASATALAGTVRALRSSGRCTPVVGVAITLRDVAGFDLIGDFVEVVPLVISQDIQLEKQLQQRLIGLHDVKWSWPSAFAANPELRRAAFEGRLHHVTMTMVEAPLNVERPTVAPTVPHLQFSGSGRLDIVAPELQRDLVEELLHKIPQAILNGSSRAEHEQLLCRLVATQLGHAVSPNDDLLASGLTSLGMMRVAEEAARQGLPVDATMLFVHGSIEGICDAIASAR